MDNISELKKIHSEFLSLLQMEHLQYLKKIETETGLNSQNVIEYLLEKDVPDNFVALVHKMLFEYECRLKRKDERTKMISDFYINTWEVFSSIKKIKECPFCGDKEPFVERMELYSYAVRCNNCLATGNWSDEDTEKSEEEHEKEAIKNWNKRF